MKASHVSRKSFFFRRPKAGRKSHDAREKPGSAKVFDHGSTLSGYPVVMSLLSSRAGSVDPQLAMPVPEHLERIVYYYESVRVDIGDDLLEFREF